MGDTTLVCLNSEQVVANVLAMGDVRPDRIIIVSTTDMEVQYANLCSCAEQMGLQVPENPVIVPPHDFTGISEALSRQISPESNSQRIVINATGGTKPMALVTLEHFKGWKNVEAIYVDSRNSLKYRFSPGPAQKEQLSYFPPIPIYLRAYGLGSKFNIPENWLGKASSFLAQNYDGVAGLVSKISNACSPQGLPSRIMGVRTLHPRSMWHRFLKLLHDQNVIRGFSSLQGDVLEILWENHAEASYYFNQGGWLEHLIYHGLKDSAEELCLNLSVQLAKETNESNMAEYDVVARKGAILYFFECKSGTHIYNGSQLSQAIQSFQAKVKLTGGIMSQPVFVLAHRFKRPSELHAARARFAGVKLIDYEQIRDNLEETLEAILNPFPSAT